MLEDLYDTLDRVVSKHFRMISLAENVGKINAKTLTNLAEWAVSAEKNAIQSLQDRLHLLVTGNNDSENPGLLVLVAHLLKVSKTIN